MVFASQSYNNYSSIKTGADDVTSTKEKIARVSTIVKSVTGKKNFARLDATATNSSALGSIIYTNNGGESWRIITPLQGMAKYHYCTPGSSVYVGWRL